ncbi:TetR/AcrR family transcriptional regulator [Thalassospira profundimaris]|uniref:TetR/AcrR family transcriptional regulator n=1 Tax=Thalassospira profundimaris TaxID=502049 RepID=UPI0002872281|nr:TetR/AcrR family transcriptional regulator [Thalassospira profundimaris]EKF08460.1 TetR family transcriptional regulator [Thalassospira profundimaris WP0211]
MADSKKIDPRTLKRREAMIEAARELFCEHGLAGTTLEMITAEAGGSRRTIYELFGNKDGVFEAVIRDCTGRVTSMLADLDLAQKPLRDALIEFGETLMTMLTTSETIRYLRLYLSEVPRFPHLGKVFYESGLMTGRRIITDYFEHQMALGNFPKGNAAQAAVFFTSLLKADYDFRQMTYVGWEPQASDLHEHVIAAVDMFLRGYGFDPAKMTS